MNPAWFCAALSADLGTEEESKSHADLEERRGGDVMMFRDVKGQFWEEVQNTSPNRSQVYKEISTTRVMVYPVEISIYRLEGRCDNKQTMDQTLSFISWPESDRQLLLFGNVYGLRWIQGIVFLCFLWVLNPQHLHLHCVYNIWLAGMGMKYIKRMRLTKKYMTSRYCV